MKKIAIIWTTVLILIIGCLTAYGFKIKKDNIGNFSESELITQTKKYLGLYPALYPTKGEKITLTSEKLKDEGYDPTLDKECSGYVVVENTEMGFTYNAYVKCPDYITKGYFDGEGTIGG